MKTVMKNPDCTLDELMQSIKVLTSLQAVSSWAGPVSERLTAQVEER